MSDHQVSRQAVMGNTSSACDPTATLFTRGVHPVPVKRANAKEQVHYHKDGTIWAKGRTIDGVMTGYWEWFRKDGSLMRSGYFEAGEQVGEWTTYDRSGTPVKVTVMKSKKAK
jgi:antitoxin component YwqK of YwqJK toxin-antitoxin module